MVLGASSLTIYFLLIEYNTIFTSPTRYFDWKADAPIMKYVMLFVLAILPVALIQVIVNFFHTFTRKATPLRNIVDIVNVFTLAYVIYNSAAIVGPLEGGVRAAAAALTEATAVGEEAGLNAAKALLASVEELYVPTLISLILNIIQISYPMYVFSRYFNN